MNPGGYMSAGIDGEMNWGRLISTGPLFFC